MKIIMLVLSILPIFGQEPRFALSFADQGQEVLRGTLGRRASRAGIVVFAGSVCSGDEAIVLTEGQVLRELNKAGVVVFSGAALEPLITRTDARSLASLSADIGEAVTVGGSILSSSGVIRMGDRDRQKWTFGFSAGAALFYFLRDKFKGAAVDVAKARTYRVPERFSLAAHQDCWTGNVFGLPHAAVFVPVK